MRQQRADEPFADKAAGTGNEIDHILRPPGDGRLLVLCVP